MSQAEDLLNSLSEEDIATYTADPDEEEHIVIGEDRKITVPNALKRIAVQYDHNVETVTFDCPRYWDDHDMSKMQVYINYKLGDGTIGSYIAQNVEADGDLMHFDWTITRDLTYLSDGIIFLICVRKTDDNGNEVNHWNSELCTDLYVSPGLEGTEIVASKYPEIITQLLTRMDVVETINVQASEMREILTETVAAAEIANSARTEAVAVKESVNASESHIRDSYANAIRHNVSGSYIKVDDVSPIEHTVKTNVRSKNLAVRTSSRDVVETDGVTFTANEDGTIVANGTAAANTTAYYLMQIGTGWSSQIPIKKGRYTIGIAPAQGCRISVGVRYNESEERRLYYSTYTNTISFDITSDTARFDMILCVDSGHTVENVVFEPLLVEGEVADDYTPYVDPTTVSVTSCGKNIFSRRGMTQTLNGVTCTAKEDGTVVVDGTAEKTTFFSLGSIHPVVGAKHRLSGCPSGADFDTYILYIHNNTTGADIYDLGSGKVFTGTAGDQGVTIAVYAGTTVSNLTFYPMVVIGEEVETFEPFTGAAYTPASDGTVEGVRSVSPVMSVVSDNPGVILDVEYNKDLNSIFDEINSLLEQLLNGGV